MIFHDIVVAASQSWQPCSKFSTEPLKTFAHFGPNKLKCIATPHNHTGIVWPCHQGSEAVEEEEVTEASAEAGAVVGVSVEAEVEEEVHCADADVGEVQVEAVSEVMITTLESLPAFPSSG